MGAQEGSGHSCAALLPHGDRSPKRAGISEPTLHRWMRREDFKSEYQKARVRTLELASERLQRGTLAAVEVLQQIASDKTAPSASRVMAARSFLEATGLLKGMAVTVNNQTLPQSSEEVMQAIKQQLGSMLRTDEGLREMVRSILAEVGDGKLSIQ